MGVFLTRNIGWGWVLCEGNQGLGGEHCCEYSWECWECLEQLHNTRGGRSRIASGSDECVRSDLLQNQYGLAFWGDSGVIDEVFSWVEYVVSMWVCYQRWKLSKYVTIVERGVMVEIIWNRMFLVHVVDLQKDTAEHLLGKIEDQPVIYTELYSKIGLAQLSSCN